jgi:hypothetical protein
VPAGPSRLGNDLLGLQPGRRLLPELGHLAQPPRARDRRAWPRGRHARSPGAGCHNIDFVTPAHIVPQILAAARSAAARRRDLEALLRMPEDELPLEPQDPCISSLRFAKAGLSVRQIAALVDFFREQRGPLSRRRP